ncbi:MAG: ABC transporter permease [Gemmatimonadetes bacterium]|nr:ABC transporter permease [Gemmatimonadota bacterium]
MAMWASDLRHASRGLRRRPMVSAVVVTTLALAVGVSTAIFSVVNGVLLRPLPYPEPDELVQLWQTNEDWLESPSAVLRSFAMRFPLSVPVRRDWERMSPVFEDVGGYMGARFVATGGDRPERIPGQRVTSGLFRALGVEPLLGRALLPEEDEVGSGLVAVLSYEYWQSRFAGDAGVVGRTVILDEAPYSIVGVMPREFYFPTEGDRVWTNLTDEQKQRSRSNQSMSGVARLKPGVTMETAEREMQAVTARIQEAYPDEQGSFGFRMTSRVAEVVGAVRPMLLLLLGSVGLVLLIACANVANLLFVAGLTRRKELAVKAALGAGARRLIRSLLVESALLAAVPVFSWQSSSSPRSPLSCPRGCPGDRRSASTRRYWRSPWESPCSPPCWWVSYRR